MNEVINKQDVVLVVDDSFDSLSMINDALDSSGFRVLVSLDGEQALTIADNITPDIILMDALMPNIDGFETCYRLKKKPSFEHVPVIFMTGLTDTESILKALESGGVDYVTKPVKPDELIARMRVHLANARLTLSARAALDTAGQYFFSASTEGDLLWATPQAYQLMDSLGMTTSWRKDHLPEYLGRMTSEYYNKENGLHININQNELELRYIAHTNRNEYLIRIIDPSRPSETDILKNIYSLTKRESEVLLWVAKGKTNREIAMILSLSPRTINKHLEQIYRKLGVENRTAAAARAIKILR